MLRSHNLAFCGWVNMKIYKLDMYIENDIHIPTPYPALRATDPTHFAIFILSLYFRFILYVYIIFYVHI